MDLFNYLTSEKGRGIISNGWKAAFIKKALCSGLNGLEPLDLFQGIDPLATENSNTKINILFNNDDVDFFVTSKSYKGDDDDDAWIDVNGEDGEDINGEDGEDVSNIFDIIEDIVEEN